VPPLFTVTAPVPVPLPVVLFTCRVPALIVVPPLYVFAAVTPEGAGAAFDERAGAAE
jgi:hypothetical protein